MDRIVCDLAKCNREAMFRVSNRYFHNRNFDRRFDACCAEHLRRILEHQYDMDTPEEALRKETSK